AARAFLRALLFQRLGGLLGQVLSWRLVVHVTLPVIGRRRREGDRRARAGCEIISPPPPVAAAAWPLSSRYPRSTARSACSRVSTLDPSAQPSGPPRSGWSR